MDSFLWNNDNSKFADIKERFGGAGEGQENNILLCQRIEIGAGIRIGDRGSTYYSSILAWHKHF